MLMKKVCKINICSIYSQDITALVKLTQPMAFRLTEQTFGEFSVHSVITAQQALVIHFRVNREPLLRKKLKQVVISVPQDTSVQVNIKHNKYICKERKISSVSF